MEPLEFIYDDVDPNNNNNEFILDEIQNINREFDLISFSNLFKEIKYETKSAIINLNEKSIEFITIKMQNHGRKRITELIGNKIHRSTDYDNILSKIQIHFFNFLVNFANDAIRTVITNNKERKKFEFKHIKHKNKRKISQINLEILIKMKLCDILQQTISKKYRKLSLDEDYNKNIYNKVIDLSDWLKKLFRCQPLECFEFEDKIIKFSKKTKSFFCLYNKAKNQKEKIRLKFIAGVYYLRLGNPTTFITEISAEL